MTLPADTQWFTEVCAEGGSALSYAINAKLHEEKTPFQTIAIYDTTHHGHLMTIDGFVMLTQRDNFLYHEMLAHPVLFTHPAPKDVVIIGGGDCGTLQEVLKHPTVTSVTQIDIDEQVTRLAELYFPELCMGNDDPRAHLLFADGIQWMAVAPDNSIDVVIVDSTDPVGPGEGLFTEDFYRNCHRALRADGVIVQQSESPLYHFDSIIRPMHQAMRAAGFAHTHTLQFPQPCYPTGWWTATMAGKNQPLTTFRRDHAANKPFATKYYNADIHQGALAMPEFMRETLS